MVLMVWCGVVWCGVVWCGVVWCGVVWCGVVWCGMVWCGEACRVACRVASRGVVFSNVCILWWCCFFCLIILPFLRYLGGMYKFADGPASWSFLGGALLSHIDVGFRSGFASFCFYKCLALLFILSGITMHKGLHGRCDERFLCFFRHRLATHISCWRGTHAYLSPSA